MLLDIAIALSCAGSGVVCGWIMHALGGTSNETLVKQAAAKVGGTTTASPEKPSGPTEERIAVVAERLQEHAAAMAADVDAHQTKVQAVNNTLVHGDSSPESVLEAVNQLIAANQVMQSQLQDAQDRIHEQSAQLESAERRAFTDALTRIPNRGAFDAHIAEQHAKGPGKAGTLALLDVDHFKKFNDLHGHLAGDEVLRVVAGVLNARLKPHGLVARYGGEEFVVLLDSPIDEAKDVVEAARVAIGDREIEFEDKRLHVTASVGVAELLVDESIEEWIARADSGLYFSKESGRDCGHWMDNEDPMRIELAVQPGQKVEEIDPDDMGAFTGLPTKQDLTEEYEEILERTQSTVSIFVMAIACTTEAPDSTMRSLLQIVRATLRSVDRIGCEDRNTLLVCMPSVDEETAYQRSMQICRSAQTIGLTSQGAGENPVAVGVAKSADEEQFPNTISRALHLSKVASNEGAEPVCVEGRETSNA